MTHWRTMSDDNIIRHVDCEMRKYLRKVISNVITFHSYIPKDVDDIYWEFMFRIPHLIRNICDEAWDDRCKIIGAECRYFTKNTCRLWSTRAHQVLNRAFSFDETLGLADPLGDDQETYELVDTSNNKEQVNEWLDMSLLSPTERCVFEFYFVQNLSLRQVAARTNMTVYRIRVVIQRLLALARQKLGS